jgi:hypothetical protein
MYKAVKGLKENYQYCLDHADLVYTNSKETYEWFSDSRADVVHISNGVDNKVFDDSRPLPIPEDIMNIPSPIVGYAGKMQELFDVDLVEKSIVRNVKYNILCSLDKKLNQDGLRRYGNIQMLLLGGQILRTASPVP